MTTACCPTVALTKRPSPPQCWLATLRRHWAAWRAESERRAEWHALEELSDNTRRDIGLVERAPLVPGRVLWEHERGLW